MTKAPPADILLFEPATLLRRTVSLTVRSLAIANLTEAATYGSAHEVCERRRFDGAVIAIDARQEDGAGCDGLALLQRIRDGKYASPTSIPVAVLVESCDANLLQILMANGVKRILIKPFRARDVIDTIGAMRKLPPLAT
jgi:CheY-like chemotaxis protein